MLIFFFNDTATTEIYTLSLHDALPIYTAAAEAAWVALAHEDSIGYYGLRARRSEEHTSELQSRLHLVCRLLLEKKKAPRNLGQPRRCAQPRPEHARLGRRIERRRRVKA